MLVNNAGRIESTEGPLWEAEPESIKGVVDADVLGVALMVDAFAPVLIAGAEATGRPSRIIDLNSGSGAQGTPAYAVYSASKASLFRIPPTPSSTSAMIWVCGSSRSAPGESWRPRSGRSPCRSMTSAVKAIGPARSRSPTWRWLCPQARLMPSPGGMCGQVLTPRNRFSPRRLPGSQSPLDVLVLG